MSRGDGVGGASRRLAAKLICYSRSLNALGEPPRANLKRGPQVWSYVDDAAWRTYEITRVQRSIMASLSQLGRPAARNQAKCGANQRKLLLPMQALSLRLTCSPGLRFCTAVFEVCAADRGEGPAWVGAHFRGPRDDHGPAISTPRLPSHRKWPAGAVRAHAAQEAACPSQRWITAQRRVEEPGLRLQRRHVQEWR